MKVILPFAINDTTLVGSNLAEDGTYTAWSAATTYAAGDYAYSAATHRVYRSVQAGNLNHDPTTDDGTWWVNYSATNKWKAFDWTISDRAEGTGTIEYEIEPPVRADSVAFFGLEASQVTVEIYDLSAALVHSETQSVADDSEIIDWYTFFTTELDYEQELLFSDLPLFTGYSLQITIGDGVGTTKVGQIVVGKLWTLGTTLDGTEIGFRDFSLKEQDDFGNLTITERGYADTATFVFAMPTNSARFVKRLLVAARATPCVYFADVDMLDTATFVFGFFDDFSVPLSAGGTSTAILEIKGLI